MLTVCSLLIFSIAYTTGNPVRSAFDKGHLKEDALSNLQLQIPVKGNQQHRGQRLETSGDLFLLPKGPFSAIPSEEFILDDAPHHIFLVKLQKTTKKDLSQDQSGDTLSSAELDNEAKSLKILLQKCQKLLQIERLRSHQVPVLKQSLVEPESEDRQSLLSMCREHFGLVVKPEEAQSVGNFGVDDAGRVAGNLFTGSGQENFLANIFSGLQNQQTSYDGVPKNQGLGPLLQGILSPQGHKPPQMVGHAGQGGVALNSIGGTYGEIGLGGEAGTVVVGGTGGIDNDAGQAGSVVPHLFLANQAKKAARIYNKIYPKCYVGSLAYGGKGAQIGNFALSGGTLGNSKASSCGHAHCIHIHLLSLEASRAEEDDLSVMSALRPAPAPLESRVKVTEVNKFRPIGGRRDWTTLDNQHDDRLLQYINKHKPWRQL